MKWTAMMLPEHVKMLRDLDKAQDKVDKPSLDEQQIEDINQRIVEAMEYNQELVFYYYIAGEIRFIIGRVHYVDTLKREFRILDGHQHLNIIKFDEIVDVKNK